MEQLRQPHAANAAGGGAAQSRSHAHLLGHVLRLGVGADRHVHALADVAADILHHLAIAREDDGAMRHRRSSLVQDVEVAPAPPLHQRVVIEEDRVAQQHVGRKQPFLVQPLHRRHAMPTHDLLELRNVLRAVHGHLDTALSRGGQTVAHQLGAAGIDLHGRQHAAQPPRRVSLRGINRGERGREIAAALLEIPDIVEPMAGRHVPLGVAIHRRGDGADPGVGQDVEPAVIGHGEVGHRGAAALQELGDRILGRGPVRF